MFTYKKLILLSGAAILLSACTTVQTERSYTPVSAKPVVAKNSLSKKFSCYESALKRNPYIFENKQHSAGIFVKDVVDGTIPAGTGAVNDSPLTDSGRLQMLSSLGKLFANHREILVGYYFPRAFENTQEGINHLGFVSDTAVRELTNGQLYLMNNKIRVQPELIQPKLGEPILVTSADFFVLEGAFSRNDTDDGVQNHGFAGSAEYDKTTKAGAELGRNKSKKYLSLTVLLAHPITNTTVETETFELSLEKNKSTAELKLGRSNISTGVTFEKEQIESLHSAQQVLIDYAALWVADQFAKYSENLLKDFKKC